MARLLWTLTVIDAAIFRQWLVASGQLPAIGQIAHFFCEMYVRLSVVGLTEGQHFELPMSQTDLGDAMGLSSVHVNRCLQVLRRDDVIEWDGNRARIVEWRKLKDLAQFDEAYLNLEVRPR